MPWNGARLVAGKSCLHPGVRVDTGRKTRAQRSASYCTPIGICSSMEGRSGRVASWNIKRWKSNHVQLDHQRGQELARLRGSSPRTHVLDCRLDSIFCQHAAVKLDRRQAQVLGNVTIANAQCFIQRLALNPFGSHRTAGNRRAAAKRFELGIHDVPIIVHLHYGASDLMTAHAVWLPVAALPHHCAAQQGVRASEHLVMPTEAG